MLNVKQSVVLPRTVKVLSTYLLIYKFEFPNTTFLVDLTLKYSLAKIILTYFSITVPSTVILSMQDEIIHTTTTVVCIVIIQYHPTTRNIFSSMFYKSRLAWITIHLHDQFYKYQGTRRLLLGLSVVADKTCDHEKPGETICRVLPV